MPVKPADTVPFQPVEAVPGVSRQVLLGPADQVPNFFLRKFKLEPGTHMPLHVNEVEHEQYVLSGRAEVTIGDELCAVAAGDTVYIPAGVPHDYRAGGDEPFVFLCAVPNRPDRITFCGER